MANIRNVAKRVLAGFMALWLSGFVFLFCCQNKAAAADMEFCPLAKAGHCDKGKPVDPSVANVDWPQPPCADCCAFLPVVFDKSRKIEPVQKQLAIKPLPAIEVVRFIPAARHGSGFAVVTVGLIRDKGSTYLRNSVFRL